MSNLIDIAERALEELANMYSDDIENEISIDIDENDIQELKYDLNVLQKQVRDNMGHYNKVLEILGEIKND